MTMAFTTVPGTWDLDPVHSIARFGVFVPVGGFAADRFGELRGRTTVAEDGAICDPLQAASTRVIGSRVNWPSLARLCGVPPRPGHRR